MNGFKPFMIYVYNYTHTHTHTYAYKTMKIYVADMDIQTIDTKKLTQNHIHKTERSIKRIYSESGIIEIDTSGKLWKMEIVDENYTDFLLDDEIKLYIDKSTMKRKNEVFQIVPEHVSVIIDRKTYSLSSKSLVKIIIESVDDSISDIYFETEMDIQQLCVREDIVTFLVLLNFISYI